MGQRLVINIKDNNNKQVATSYYHWSGFSKYAIELTKTVLNGIEEDGNYIRALKLTGATLEEDDNRDRNNGLIDTNKKEMENSLGWGEQIVTICLNEESKLRYLDIDKLFDKHAYINDFKKYDEYSKEEKEKINIEWVSKSDAKSCIELLDKILELMNEEYYFWFYAEEFYKAIY